MGALTILFYMESTVALKIGGQDRNHKFQTKQLFSNPKQEVTLNNNFAGLSYISTPNLSDKTTCVHSSMLSETYLIHPLSCVNIWIYGMEITYCGFIQCGEFWKKSALISKGKRVFQYSSTKDVFSDIIQE